jgi:EpsG family
MVYYVLPLIVSICAYIFPSLTVNSYDSESSRKSSDLFQQYIIIFLCLFCVLLSGLRFDTGSDWDAYYETFKHPGWDYPYEMGYLLFNNILSAIELEYNFFLIIVSSVFILLFYYAKKISPFINKWILMLFMYANIYVLFLGGNRQAIAVGFSSIGTLLFIRLDSSSNVDSPGDKLLQRQTLRYHQRQNLLLLALCAWLVGFLFHSSSLILVFVTIVAHIIWKKNFIHLHKITLFYNLLTIINKGENPLASLLIPIFQATGYQRFMEYLDGQEYLNPALDYGARDLLIILSNIVLLLIAVAARKTIFKVFIDGNIYSKYIFDIALNMTSIFYLIFPLFLGVSRNAAGRFLVYGRISEAIVFSIIGGTIAINHKRLLFPYLSFIILFSIVKVYFSYISPTFYLPYKNILFPDLILY